MNLERSGLTVSEAAAITTQTPLLWVNPERHQEGAAKIDGHAFLEAEDRLRRAENLLAVMFGDAIGPIGLESPLCAVPRLGEALGLSESSGQLLLKADHLLPVAGSIKARGGFHEVLAHAESLALDAGLLLPGSDLLPLSSKGARELFSDRCIAVGSTGNLGLSIGTLAAALGFKAVVHMSHEAKAWKKAELRRRGAMVVEHQGDYEVAVAEGRRLSSTDPNAYFVDDENSRLLLEGYAAAARPLAKQLAAIGRTPSASKPLFVYLPCGVGGAPGGISLGLTNLFGENVHCFFAEPVAAPCMLLKMSSAPDGEVSVYDYGLDNVTAADGLAVPRASALVAQRIRNVLSGVFTVTDEQLFSGLLSAWDCEGLAIEPSAAAGFAGPQWILNSDIGRTYTGTLRLDASMHDATHLLWTTGGSLVPEADHVAFRELAREMEVE